MKLEVNYHDFVSALLEKWRTELKIDDLALKLIRQDLIDNIPMNVRLNSDGIRKKGEIYEVPYKYWLDFTSAHYSCCGSCNEDSLAELERSKNTMMIHATNVEHCIDF